MNAAAKIAMVTGAGSGIGQACALALLSAGYAVVLAGRRKEALERTISLAPQIPIEDLSLAQWDDVVEVNLSGAFLCARAAFRLMKEQRPRGGRIINNGSLSAHAPRPMSAPYSSSREEPTMDVRHVADAVVHMASLPLSTNVQFLTLMAAKMPFIGRG